MFSFLINLFERDQEVPLKKKLLQEIICKGFLLSVLILALEHIIVLSMKK